MPLSCLISARLYRYGVVSTLSERHVRAKEARAGPSRLSMTSPKSSLGKLKIEMFPIVKKEVISSQGDPSL